MAGETGAKKTSTFYDIAWGNRSKAGKAASLLLTPIALASGAALGVAASPFYLMGREVQALRGKEGYEKTLSGQMGGMRQSIAADIRNWSHDPAKTQEKLLALDFLPSMLTEDQQEKALDAIGRMPLSAPHKSRLDYQYAQGQHLSNGFTLPGSGKPAKDEKSEAEPDKTFSDVLAESKANPEDEELKAKEQIADETPDEPTPTKSTP